MAQAITIPRLGWSMEEGTFVEWLKPPGSSVRAGDMLFILEGEKAAQEIEALDTGYLHLSDPSPKRGDIVKVGQVIGYLLAEGEAPPVAAHPTPTLPPVPQTQTPTRIAGPAARRLARQLGIDLHNVPTPDPTGRVLCEDVQQAANTRPATGTRPIATPRARRRAKELGIDWTQLHGSGRGGRIRERDVPLPQSATPLPHTPGQHTPASKIRQIIAQRMSAGVHQAVPVTLTTKVNATALVAYRTGLKNEVVVPSYNDILLALVAKTLRELPALNACWQGDGIYRYEAVHLASAVDTEAGLLAPVLRHADQQSLQQIAEQTKELAAMARSGELNQQHLEGGTFTVTNLGMFGIDAFTPILNLPQAGILGVGRIVEEPVVRGGTIGVEHTLTLSLTFDHRVLDGAPAARWLQRLGEHLQQLPNALL